MRYSLCTLEKDVNKGFKPQGRHQQKINNREVSGSVTRTINSFKISKIQMTFQNRNVIWTEEGKLSRPLLKLIQIQECIPVGCIPSAAEAVSRILFLPHMSTLPCTPPCHTHPCHTHPMQHIPPCHACPPDKISFKSPCHLSKILGQKGKSNH